MRRRWTICRSTLHDDAPARERGIDDGAVGDRRLPWRDACVVWADAGLHPQPVGRGGCAMIAVAGGIVLAVIFFAVVGAILRGVANVEPRGPSERELARRAARSAALTAKLAAGPCYIDDKGGVHQGLRWSKKKGVPVSWWITGVVIIYVLAVIANLVWFMTRELPPSLRFGVTGRCVACVRFFSRYQCAMIPHGECDCPRCQGYCQCKARPMPKPKKKRAALPAYAKATARQGGGPSDYAFCDKVEFALLQNARAAWVRVPWLVPVPVSCPSGRAGRSPATRAGCLRARRRDRIQGRYIPARLRGGLE